MGEGGRGQPGGVTGTNMYDLYVCMFVCLWEGGEHGMREKFFFSCVVGLLGECGMSMRTRMRGRGIVYYCIIIVPLS
jgi:hypothetical protein